MSNGVVLYDGPSMWDGERILAIATGTEKPSKNPKTGPMIQVWIIRADQDPVSASRVAADESVCGDCPARRASGGHCYVTLAQAPLSVWRAWRNGSYADASTPGEIASVGAGRAVRVGAYGDPAMVPSYVWTALLSRANVWTGYTHQWDKPIAEDLRGLVMASCDSEEEAIDAAANGWRYFRVGEPGSVLPREVECLSESVGMACADCGMCDGAKPDGRGKSVRIAPHGAVARSFGRILQQATGG